MTTNQTNEAKTATQTFPCLFCRKAPRMNTGQHPNYCTKCAGWTPSKAMCQDARP